MLDAVVWVAALVLALPFGVVGVESFAASLGRRARAVSRRTPRTAVLVPAHDEEAEIAQTLIEVSRELREGDRLVVVADNSTDATAEIAASHGAEVVERVDPLRTGKGFALEAGIQHLASDPPEVVVVVDADCRPEPGALRRIAARARSEDRPVQGASLVAPSDDGFLSKVSALAFHARNEIRPGGLERLGMPVLLQGTGMAIPWHQIEGAPLGGNHLAEDRKLGISLAIEGNTPRFEPEARFWSSLEPEASASGGQRSRWERGHFAVVSEEIPRLLGRAVRDRRADLGALAAELSVPPLALLLKAWSASVLVALGLGASTPAVAALTLPGAACFLLLGIASARSPSAPVSSGFLLAAPLYALAKAPLYARAMMGQKMGWVRARRRAVDAEAAAVATPSEQPASQCASAD